jgi:hypothetical protein
MFDVGDFIFSYDLISAYHHIEIFEEHADKATSDICREQLKNKTFAIGHSPLYCF